MFRNRGVHLLKVRVFSLQFDKVSGLTQRLSLASRMINPTWYFTDYVGAYLHHEFAGLDITCV